MFTTLFLSFFHNCLDVICCLFCIQNCIEKKLRGIDKKTGRREGIEPIKRDSTYFLYFSNTLFMAQQNGSICRFLYIKFQKKDSVVTYIWPTLFAKSGFCFKLK